MPKIMTTLLGPLLSIGVGMGSCATGTVPSTPVAFKGTKGVNLHNWGTWTAQTSESTYKLPVFARPGGALSDDQLSSLHKAGFDFVRLTVDPGVFVILNGAPRDQALQSLRSIIDKVRAQGLSVIVDMHPVRAVFPFGKEAGGGSKPFEQGADTSFAQRYAQATAWLAGQLDRNYGATEQVAFELMNEPDLACDDQRWPAQEISLHQAVRAAAPRLTLILTGACWSDINGLTELDPAAFKDNNTFYTFHFYDEHRFTHAGVNSGAGPSNAALSMLGGLPYPWNARPQDEVMAEISKRSAAAGAATQAAAMVQAQKYFDKKWDRSKIEQRMDVVVQWARMNNIASNRILMGEFGVNRRRGTVMGAYPQDRLRWLTDTREAAEARGFRWAMWAYGGHNNDGDFDLLDDAGQAPEPATLHALGLK